MAAWRGLVVPLGILAVLGCRREDTTTPDPCEGGDCQTQCEFGPPPCWDPFEGKTVSNHSPIAGTFDDDLNASCPFPPEEVPPLEALLDDSKIPEFDRGRRRRTNYSSGGQHLQDHELHQHLLGVQGALFECLDLAACYQEGEPVGTGELDFRFELEPNGQVSAVSVQPSAGLDQPIVRACARRSVYEFKFPSWKGARMVVDYRVQIEESV